MGDAATGVACKRADSSKNSKDAQSELYVGLTVEEADDVVRGINQLKRKVADSRPRSSKGASLIDAPKGSDIEADIFDRKDVYDKKPLDVFTATALIQEKIEERKRKAKTHLRTAPEAVAEAYTTFGVKTETKPSSVWDCLDKKTAYDLGELRVTHMVCNCQLLPAECHNPGLHYLLHDLLHGGCHGRDQRVPRDVFSNTRLAPTVREGAAYLTIDTACENTVGGKTHLNIWLPRSSRPSVRSSR